MTTHKDIVSGRKNANDNTTDQRRRFPRRDCDVCMVNVDGHPFPVVDWSQCGVLFEGDTRFFAEGQTVNMILRFKTADGVEDIKITGKIVRKNGRAVATTFSDLPERTLKSFEKIIERSVA
tara:strand:+ start:1000 stop:1362 length:363 start_codon:yes stop_codon:yes gene_type:complete